jgi:hypothetical protein
MLAWVELEFVSVPWRCMVVAPGPVLVCGDLFWYVLGACASAAVVSSRRWRSAWCMNMWFKWVQWRRVGVMPSVCEMQGGLHDVVLDM